MDYQEWIESQRMESERPSLIPRPLTDVDSSWYRPARVGERQVQLTASDAHDQLVTAGLELLDSGDVERGLYQGRPLTNLEMYAMIQAYRFRGESMFTRSPGSEVDDSAGKDFAERAHDIAGVTWRFHRIGCLSYLGALESCLNVQEVETVVEYASTFARDRGELEWIRSAGCERIKTLQKGK